MPSRPGPPRHLRRVVSELLQAVGDRAADAAVCRGHRPEAGEHEATRRDRGSPPRTPARFRCDRVPLPPQERGETQPVRQDDSEQQQQPERRPGVRADRDVGAVLREGVLRERPRDRRDGGDHRGPDHGERPEPERHDEEPQPHDDHRGEQTAARVGQEQRRHEQDARGRRQCREGRRHLAPRAEPDGAHQAHRGDHPDRVPVTERLPEARIELELAERLGPHTRGEAVRDDHDCGERDPGEDRAQAAGEEVAGGDRRREDEEVGERPVRLDPALVRCERPCDRQARDDREQDERQHRAEAVQARRGPKDRSGGQRKAGGQHEADLDRDHTAELRPALADERNRYE